MRKTKIKFALLLTFLILPARALAQDKSFSETHLTERGQKAFQTLLSASQFESTNIGYGGELSKLVDAYRVLLEEEKRVEALKVLLEKATIAGQLYALCGLYDTDYNYFLSVIENYKTGEVSVRILSGCIGRVEFVRQVVFLDEPNTVRLSSPTQPFDEWLENAKLDDREGFRLDISGGGYPMFFRGKSSGK